MFDHISVMTVAVAATSISQAASRWPESSFLVVAASVLLAWLRIAAVKAPTVSCQEIWRNSHRQRAAATLPLPRADPSQAQPTAAAQAEAGAPGGCSWHRDARAAAVACDLCERLRVWKQAGAHDRGGFVLHQRIACCLRERERSFPCVGLSGSTSARGLPGWPTGAQTAICRLQGLKDSMHLCAFAFAIAAAAKVCSIN